MRFPVLLFGTICIIVLFPNKDDVLAASKHKWEMGLGYIDFQVPHYLGSNHYYKYKIPFPRLIYRFDNLELSRDSRYYLFDSTFFQIDIALSGNWPVFSDEADADTPEHADDPDAVLARTTNFTRRGMPDLPVTVFAGLRLRLYFTDHIILEIPYYHGGKLESDFTHAGNTNEMKIRLEVFDRDSDHQLGLITKNSYGDEKYNNFYYQVKENEALLDREAFDAETGLIAFTYGLSFYFQLSSRFSVSGRYYINNMAESIVRKSPLVISESSTDYYLTISYSFFLSDNRVNIP